MKPSISEFSYGFALTSELTFGAGTALTAAPVFPSLYQEGQAGGGWDVKLQRPGLPLFLQFKLSDFMSRRSCREARSKSLDVPCYRFYLRAARSSGQHELLLELEQSGQEVYYSAPGFHEPPDLDEAFLTREMRARSVWIRPSQIGRLPDNREHHVSFRLGGTWVLFSEPRRLEGGERTFTETAHHLQEALHARGSTALQPDSLHSLAQTIELIAQRRVPIPVAERHSQYDRTFRAHPLERVAYYASVFLDCQLFVVQARDDATA